MQTCSKVDVAPVDAVQVDGLTLLDMLASDVALEELGVRSAIHRSRIRGHANAARGTVRGTKRAPDPPATGVAGAAATGAAAADSPPRKRKLSCPKEVIGFVGVGLGWLLSVRKISLRAK